MKRYRLFLAVVFVLLWSVTTHATMEVVRFSGEFVRDAGKPAAVCHTFSAINGPAVVRLKNGDLENDFAERVSSSIVIVNERIVFDSSNFNQNVDCLESEVILVEGYNNTLEVMLKGKPGGQVTIQITQEIPNEPTAVIGPDGGTVEVTDPNSPIYMAKVEVPPGALSEEVTIAIKQAVGAPPIPGTAELLSQIVSLEPDGIVFDHPVKITIPYDDSDVYDENVPQVFIYGVDSWHLATCLDRDKDINTITVVSTHFCNAAVLEIMAQQNPKLELFPPKHQFPILNDTTYNGGWCWGIVGIIKSYFENKTVNDESDILMTAFTTLEARRAANLANKLLNDALHSYWEKFGRVPYHEDEYIGNALYQIINSKELFFNSQILGLWIQEKDMVNGTWDGESWKDTGKGHAVIVYGYEIDSQNIRYKVLDPDSRESLLVIVYNKSTKELIPNFDPGNDDLRFRMTIISEIFFEDENWKSFWEYICGDNAKITSHPNFDISLPKVANNKGYPYLDLSKVSSNDDLHNLNFIVAVDCADSSCNGIDESKVEVRIDYGPDISSSASILKTTHTGPDEQCYNEWEDQCNTYDGILNECRGQGWFPGQDCPPPDDIWCYECEMAYLNYWEECLICPCEEVSFTNLKIDVGGLDLQLDDPKTPAKVKNEGNHLLIVEGYDGNGRLYYQEFKFTLPSIVWQETWDFSDFYECNPDFDHYPEIVSICNNHPVVQDRGDPGWLIYGSYSDHSASWLCGIHYYPCGYPIGWNYSGGMSKDCAWMDSNNYPYSYFYAASGICIDPEPYVCGDYSVQLKHYDGDFFNWHCTVPSPIEKTYPQYGTWCPKDVDLHLAFYGDASKVDVKFMIPYLSGSNSFLSRYSKSWLDNGSFDVSLTDQVSVSGLCTTAKFCIVSEELTIPVGGKFGKCVMYVK